MTTNLDLIPQTTKGTRFGWSFLKTFKVCPMRWFNTYLRPMPDGGVGTESLRTSKPLFVGDLFHHGLEAWYMSGWEDGNYSIDAAVVTLRQRSRAQAEGVSEEDLDAWEAEAEDLLLSYHVYYGPGGLAPEYPQYQVAATKDGTPLIEQEFVIDLGYGGYVFTSRIDACMMFNKTDLVALETKTVDASRVSRLMQQFQVDGQCTGEIWLLRSAFPTIDDAGLHLNMIFKRAGKGKDPFRRETYHRSALDLETFRLNTVRTLRQIDDHIGEYQRLVEAGVDIDEAARRVFDSSPDGFTCCGNYACTFLPACAMKGHEAGWFKAHTKARSLGEMRATNNE